MMNARWASSVAGCRRGCITKKTLFMAALAGRPTGPGQRNAEDREVRGRDELVKLCVAGGGVPLKLRKQVAR